MNVKCFKIECLTNLHVGSGDVNFNIIDKEVERDPILETPTIHASGVKGALREHLKGKNNPNEEAYFGKPNQANSNELVTGRIKILGANLLAIPMRSTDRNEFYYMVTNKALLERYKELNEAFGVAAPSLEVECEGTVLVEGIACPYTAKELPVAARKLAVMKTEDFKRIPLPVVARNRVNGGSNLWYEEIVPHKSVFYFHALAGDSDQALLEQFAKDICRECVQFGGNASVGCGLCKITEIGG